MATSPDSVSYPIVGYGLAVALDEGTGTYNYGVLTESDTGDPVRLLAKGEDTNIDWDVVPKGAGTVRFGSNYADYITISGAANTGVVNTASPIIQAAGAATTMDVKVLGAGTNGRLNSTKVYIGPGSVRSAVSDATIAYIRTDMGYTTTAAPGLRFGGNFFGTVTSGQVFFNQWVIDSDTVDCSTVGGPQSANGLYIGHTMAAGAKGGRVALNTFLQVTGAITLPSSGSGSFVVAEGATAQASVNAGGTSGLGNGRGNLFGGNWITNLQSGATFWRSIVGGELTISAASGSSVYYKNGLQIVQATTDAVSGTGGFDSAILIAQQIDGASPGWDEGLAFGSAQGWWGIKSTGTLIGTVPSTGGLGPAYTAAFGVDLSAVTFSTAAFKSTGFEVDGIGRTTGAAFILTSGGPRIVQGSGAPSALLVLTKGSLYLRNDGGVGSTLYVTQGAGTWNAVAGV